VFDWWILLAILYGLYVVECLAWIDRGSWVCFTVPVRGLWRCTRGGELPGNDRGGLLLANPLSASPAVVVCGLWPISISPAGVSNATSGEQPASGTPAYIPFTQIRSVRGDVNGLYVNGRLLAHASMPLAVFLASLIDDCRKADGNRREKEIRKALAAAADSDKALARWTESRQQTRTVAVSAAILFWYTLVIAPIVIAVIGPYPTWPWLLAGLIISTAATATHYYQAHARLYPALRFERWVQTIAMILLPVGAIRAAVNLSRHLLEHHSPFAVLPALCGGDVAARELRVALWDLQRLPAENAATTEAGQCVEWCRAATVSAAIEAMSASTIDLDAAPDRDDDGSVSYCPRCHTQFKSAGIMCHICDDVPVVPFHLQAAAAIPLT
jgi:hypothetical protein